jgi:hypothetical protein
MSDTKTPRRTKLTPWQRIVRASERGHGVKLSRHDAWLLAGDDAIATKARNDDEEQKGKHYGH